MREIFYFINNDISIENMKVEHYFSHMNLLKNAENNDLFHAVMGEAKLVSNHEVEISTDIGTSLVEGFALTFGVGIMVSMFTAITVSRTFLLAVGNFKNEGKIKLLFGSGLSK